MASSGNFCTLNPLNNFVGGGGSGSNKVTISNGNLSTEDQGSYYSNFVGTHAVSGTNKFYYELRVVNEVQQGQRFGWIDLNQQQNSTTSGSNGFPGGTAATWATNNNSTITRFFNNNSQPSDSTALSGTIANGDIYCCGLDLETGKWYVSRGAALDPSSAATGAQSGTTTVNPFSNLDGGLYAPSGGEQAGADSFYNFGQDSTFGGAITAGGNADANGFGDFAFAVPSGYLAICSGNLGVSSDIDPAQTDDDYPGKNFNTVIYTGNGSTQSITGLGFKPDLVWLKRRDGTKANALFDSNRGVTKYLSSDSQGTGATDTSTLTTFGTDGFSLASPAANNLVNGNGFTYVGWCWKANGGTTSSDSSGDITVTRQSNTKGGFSILTYTGNGSADQTIAHGLGATPAFIITKNTSSNSHWAVWHQSHTGYYGQIEDTGSWASDSSQFYTDGMTSNFIGVKGSGATNDSGSSMLGYVWTEIDGYSKFGSYEGNNNADGPFVYTGGRPRLLMIRNTEQSSNWEVFDSARQTFNSNENYLRWNTTGAEGGTSTTFDVDFLSQGFKVRNTEVDLNNTRKYIYACWMDVPFKYNNTF